MKNLALFTLLILLAFPAPAQDKLYPNTFSLADVKLLDGPFKHARDLNIEVLLQYSPDRLLAPFLKEAGLPAKAESYPNWIDLDSHVAGHYLSAMAMNWRAIGNAECKRRMEYMLAELDRCQQAHGNGYVGGVPHGKEIWDGVKGGDPVLVGRYWAPWYNLHKTFAGLRDAWLYGDSPKAREMFLKLCDWGCEVIAPLDDAQMEKMLDTEFGGMCEVFADAYQISGNPKYLQVARRFSHHVILDSMAAGVDNLDNRHANTIVPKIVGYERIAELSGDPLYASAARFFWSTVVNNRSLSFGGNSRREHFPSAEAAREYVEDKQGPESCNTYNMLKLTEGLFRLNPAPQYADFYERALFNHILSTQHPVHGGYVYFTSARPGHYRVYSAPNEAMWCCVGSGMENHGKYGEFIYNHTGDTLRVNLFIASEVNWKEKGITLTQETQFPEKDNGKLTVHVKKPTRFPLLVRCPQWATQGMQVMADGKNYAAKAVPSSYVVIDKVWKDGDVVTYTIPMQLHVEPLRYVDEYISILYGPIVLGVKTGTQDMVGLIADDSRFGQIADGPMVSLFEMPYIVGTPQEIAERLQRAGEQPGKPLTFKIPGLFGDDKFKDMELMPFYKIHDSRYAIYFLSMNREEHTRFLADQQENERQKLLLDKRTVDWVIPGEQQPEVDHLMQVSTELSTAGPYEGEMRREVHRGGFVEYTLKTKGQDNLSLMVRYWGNEGFGRNFSILVDGNLLVNETTSRRWNKNDFYNVEYSIPEAMTKGKQQITVRFQTAERNSTGGLFYLRLLSGLEK